MVLRKISIVAAASLSVSIFSAQPVLAEEFKHETRFSVRFGGVEVGKATFKIEFDDLTYSLSGNGRTVGVVDWVAPGKGEFSSNGLLTGDKVEPKLHTAKVVERKKKPETLKMSFTENSVSDVEIQSNKKRKKRIAPKYIPVEAKHLAAVMDPASSLIIPMSGQDAKDGNKVCNQRFPIYDGETRYDIALRYKTTKPVETSGYNGYAYVCQMRYVPVAGHKKDHRSVKEMAENKGMEIWLAPMQGVSVFTPIQIVVGTKYGRVVAQPKYFGAAS